MVPSAKAVKDKPEGLGIKSLLSIVFCLEASLIVPFRVQAQEGGLEFSSRFYLRG